MREQVENKANLSKMSINKMACMSAFKNYIWDDNSEISVDFSEFLSSLNDNDIKKYYKIRAKKVKEIRKNTKSVDGWETVI